MIFGALQKLFCKKKMIKVLEAGCLDEILFIRWLGDLYRALPASTSDCDLAGPSIMNASGRHDG
jgi:hypothetical protein